MIQLQHARELVLARLREMEHGDGCALVLLDEETRTLPYGWIFFYTSKRYLESGDIGEMLVGNAPLLVTDRGEVHVTGTAKPLDTYLAEFERSGSPHPPAPTVPVGVRITGWRTGLQKVRMTQTIRDQTGLGLGGAKAITDAVLRGESATVPAPDWERAIQLAGALQRLGAEARPVVRAAGEPAAAPNASRR